MVRIILPTSVKPLRAHGHFGALLLVGVLAFAFESQALPLRQHATRGVIESIDPANHCLVLVEKKTGACRIFHWNETTRFRHEGKKIAPDNLQRGMEVKGYYRMEVGRFVLRELRSIHGVTRRDENVAGGNPKAATLQHSSGHKKP